MNPHGAGETAAVYQAYAAQFAARVTELHDLLTKHPELRALEAHITRTRVEVTVMGGCGVERDWTRALPPIRYHDTGIYTECQQVGVTDVLKTDRCTVTIRRPR